ncbi:MAG: 2-hydroxyacyl-CoA dehydratase, partial [Dehalococcoidia bacterium]|nr:2-hydroxyacyl-CoA dehydratase [Dehalococcoidia bacterium]
MGPLSRFTEVINDRHDYARQWKERTGGKVIGYLCTYVPEELIYAAGMLPVRIMPSHQPQDVTEPHIFSMFCPYSRGCLAEGLTGNYDYLDGIVHAHGCYHIR